MQIVGILAVVSVSLVPAPREQVWREGTCVFAEKDVRFVKDAALPPEGREGCACSRWTQREVPRWVVRGD